VHWLLTVFALAQGSVPLAAVSSEIRPSRLPVGGTFELRLAAAWPNSVSQVLPRFETWTGPFEIVDIEARPATNGNGGSESRVWLIRLRTFEVGLVRIPGMHVDFQRLGERRSVETSEVTVESLAPAVDRNGRLRPLKDVPEPQRDLADYAGLGARVALVPLAGAWLWLTVSARRQRRRPAQPFHRRRALRALQRARQRSETDVDAFYSDVSDMVRLFVEATLAIPGAVLSSMEIVAAARTKGAAPAVVQRLSEVLAAVDAVRFGGRIPSDAESREVFELTRLVLSNRDRPAQATTDEKRPDHAER
jgi:hypothetical protein